MVCDWLVGAVNVFGHAANKISETLLFAMYRPITTKR